MQQPTANHYCYLPPPFFTQYFPQSLKLLLVGIDKGTQTSIHTFLPTPYYKIFECESGLGALRYLQENGHNSFDLVISNIALKDMDGYQFIREQHLNPNIPHVAICGGERSTYEVLTAYRSGACSVLWKPVHQLRDEIVNLWRHVCRRKEQQERSSDERLLCKRREPQETSERQTQDKGSYSSLLSSKEISLEEDHDEFENHGGEPSLRKRRRVSWKEIHPLFVKTVNELGGPEKAKPRQISKRMNVPGLTTTHIGSHLQIYRETLKKVEEEQQQHHLVSHINGPHSYTYHLARQPIQMQIQPLGQTFNNFGYVVLASGSSHYSSIGTSYGSSMPQQLERVLGSSFNDATTKVANNDGIINKKQPMGNPYGSSMPQQPQPFGSNQNLTFRMQQLDQNSTLGSSSSHLISNRVANDDGIINKKQPMGNHYGISMPQQPHPFGSNQNLTSNTQQLDQNSTFGSSSSHLISNRVANNHGIINKKQPMSNPYGSSMPQQPQPFGSNQNLSSGMQQLDQNPALGSSSHMTTNRDDNNGGMINKNQDNSFGSKIIQQPQIFQDQRLEAGAQDGTINPQAGHSGTISPEAAQVNRDSDGLCGGLDGIVNTVVTDVNEQPIEEEVDVEELLKLLED